jgi:anti-anti-sigma factor
MAHHDRVSKTKEYLLPGLSVGQGAADKGALVLHLAGRLDADNAAAFDRQVRALAAAPASAPAPRVRFECGGLEEVSAAGAGAFAALYKALRRAGGGMTLAGLGAALRERLRVLGLADALGTAVPSAAKKAGRFPAVFLCPACGDKLKTPRPGRFRCGACEAVVSIDGTGQVCLG